MTKRELERIIDNAIDDAVFYYRRGDLKKGNKAEKNAKELKKLLPLYDDERGDT